MKNFNSEELLSFWKRGKSLDTAIYSLTDTAFQEEYNKQSSKFEDKTRATLETISSGGIPSVSGGFAELGKTLQLKSTIDMARRGLKNNLLNKINSGELSGLGYETPIKSSDIPQIIPLHVWPQNVDKINWDSSSFLENGINFLKIRIIKKSALKKKLDSTKEFSLPRIKVKAKKTGRPSLKAMVIEAYEYLKKEGSIDYSIDLKSHTELIQKTVQALNPEITGTAGMAHEAIRRAISKQFQADKNNL